MEGKAIKMEKGLGKSMSNDNTTTFSKDSKIRIGLLWPMVVMMVGIAATYGKITSEFGQMSKVVNTLAAKVEELNKTNLQLMLRLATNENNMERLKDRIERIEGTR